MPTRVQQEGEGAARGLVQHGRGVHAVLDAIVDLLPSPADRGEAKGTDPATKAEATRRPARGWHQPDLGVLLVAPGVGQPFAARRQAGRARLRQARGQPLRDTTVHTGTPQVVVADEDDSVTVQRRLTKIGGSSRRHGG